MIMRASSLALTVLAGLGLLSCVGSAQDPPAGSSGLGPRNVATPGTTTSSEPAVAETVAAPNVTQPPFFAGLLVLESNWSESPNARAIVDDLLKLESGAGQPSLDQGPQWLFPSTHAVFFAPQEFEQLSAWLKVCSIRGSAARYYPGWRGARDGPYVSPKSAAVSRGDGAEFESAELVLDARNYSTGTRWRFRGAAAAAIVHRSRESRWTTRRESH
jgi:hypothetical protein